MDSMNGKFIAPASGELGEAAEALLETLGGFGSDPEGGVTRLLYSPAWKACQEAIAGWMVQAGLEVYDDSVGNVFGRLTGEDGGQTAVVTGSHIDTVRCGGKYDGVYGVVGAMLALEWLSRTYGKPRRTLEAAALCEEEGSRFPIVFWGSGNVAGSRNLEQVKELTDAEGVSFPEAMRVAGYGGDGEVKRPARRNDIAAFVELHVEQGVVLEREGAAIGIVEAIVGQRRWTVEVTGEANHAGTTPMKLRRDALAAAAEMIGLLRQAAISAGEPLVATVGSLQVFPGTSNVVPGRCLFTVDIRHSDERKLEVIGRDIELLFRKAAAAHETSVTMLPTLRTAPAGMDKGMKDILESICIARRLPYKRMVSGAGHDAQMFQSVCPIAMIFVPSRDGISHSPNEYTSKEHLGQGIAVLIEMLYRIAYK